MFAGILEFDLHRQPGEKGGDEHAGPGLFGSSKTQERNSDQAEPQRGGRGPLPFVTGMQQPAADKPNAKTNEGPQTELLHYQFREVGLMSRGSGQRDEEQQERNR